MRNRQFKMETSIYKKTLITFCIKACSFFFLNFDGEYYRIIKTTTIPFILHTDYISFSISWHTHKDLFNIRNILFALFRCYYSYLFYVLLSTIFNMWSFSHACISCIWFIYKTYQINTFMSQYFSFLGLAFPSKILNFYKNF